MTPSKVLLLLLRFRKHSQRGFGLLLALLAALVTMISAASLLIRGQAGLLGEAQQSEARMAREVAEAGLNAVISELNRPGNRRLLVSTVPFTSWQANANSMQSVDQPLSLPHTSQSGFLHPNALDAKRHSACDGQARASHRGARRPAKFTLPAPLHPAEHSPQQRQSQPLVPKHTLRE
jgi:type II secretory pathway pseudopilin PulG